MGRNKLKVALLCVLAMYPSTSSRAQWGYPMGFGGFGWEGWGVGTLQGDMARGLGVMAAGEGFYNKQTAIADAIDTDTVMRWNQYIYESQMNSDRKRRERLAAARGRNIRLADEIQTRLRDNPETRDVHRGDALNATLDEINDPRVYTKALRGANARIGGELIRHIPFRYNAAAIDVGLHHLATDELPAALRDPNSRPTARRSRTWTRRLLGKSRPTRNLTPRPSRNCLARFTRPRKR